MRNISFKSIYIDYIQTPYGIEIDYNDFVTNAMIGWENIGNRNTEIKCIIEDTDNCVIYLPCDLYSIEGVFGAMIDTVQTSNKSTYPYIKSNYIESYIETWKWNKSLIYNKGKLLDYTLEGEYIRFSQDYNDVTIMYNSLISDEEGFPYVNFKEADAIGKFCAYMHLQKEAMRTKDRNSFEMAQMLKRDYLIALKKSRTPICVSQNDMDKILDAKYSWDRKQYGKSFKPDR